MSPIDGSQGESGEQILGTSLVILLMAGKPFRIINSRAGRNKPAG